MSKPQHYPIYLNDLLTHYRDGDLTAKGALRIYFRLRLAEGWKCRIKPAQIRGFFSKWSDKKGEMVEMAKTSFWRAMHELQEEGEIDFKEPESLVVRLFNKAVPNSEQPSQIRDSVPNSEQVFQIRDEDELGDIQDEGSSFPSDFSQISYKSIQCVEENFENSEITHTEILENSRDGQIVKSVEQTEPLIDLSEQTNSADLVKYSGGATATIKYDSRLGMRPPAPKPKYLIPAGDWLNSNGQLDAAFIRHTAKQWQKSSNASFHQLAIEEVEALVFSHFAKDHDALAVKWEAFTKTSTRHAEAVKLRLDAGIEIGETERLEIVGKTQAIASNKSIPLEQITIGSECEENHQAYRLIESAPIDESEQIENLKRLASLSSVIGKMPTAGKRRDRNLKTTPADINEANQWLLDPSLRTAALQWAKNQGFNFDGSEIYQEEF